MNFVFTFPFILIYNLICISAESITFWKKCIPTSVVRGPCHVCVCGLENMYECKKVPCLKDGDSSIPALFNKKCEPDYMFRLDNFICSCTAYGSWRSMNCKEVFGYLRSSKILPSESIKSSITCSPCQYYLIGCNICFCKRSGYIDVDSCTYHTCKDDNKADTCEFGDILRLSDEVCSCSDINVYIDRLCVPATEDTLQTISEKKISRLLGQIYRRPKTRDWFISEVIINCVRESKFILDCNDCVCKKDGTLVCTKYKCLSNFTDITKKVDRRSYKSRRSKKVIQKADDGKRKCVPGNTYRVSCNRCVCSGDGLLICTTMLCLKDFVFDINTLNAMLL